MPEVQSPPRVSPDIDNGIIGNPRLIPMPNALLQGPQVTASRVVSEVRTGVGSRLIPSPQRASANIDNGIIGNPRLIPMPNALEQEQGDLNLAVRSTPRTQPSTSHPDYSRRSLVPLPETIRILKTDSNIQPWAEQYLRKRASTLKKDVDESKLQQQTTQLVRIITALSPENANLFFKDPYVAENLEYFFPINADKIKLALQVSTDVQNLGRKNSFDPQFTPALNLGAFVALEMLQDSHLKGMSALQTRLMLDLKRTGGANLSWGQDALLRHTSEYLSRIDPAASGRDMEQQLTTQIALDLNGKLSARTNEMRWLGQSQGMEIEVLRHITSSQHVTDRGIDQKWLPRGIPLEKHARKDWNLLPLLGIKEDVGERAHQVYEMATHPTETTATQTTLMFELMVGGFITENMLSSDHLDNGRKGKEGYSLHVSTVFPRTIITKASLKEYKDMARALAGAFASDQRIAFGGFMSGGEEIANKSATGNLVEIGKRDAQGNDQIGQTLALIEVRNLDISLRDQYSALLHKEVLDYSFRCAWEKYTHPHRKLNAVDEFAARSWKAYRSQLQQLFRGYGIASEQLYKKHGSKWENLAWKEITTVREKNPKFKQEIASLIRKYTSQVRAYKRDSETTSTSGATEAKLESVRYLTAEPLGKQDDRLYLSYEERKKMGVRSGDVIVIRSGEKRKAVYVVPAKVRGDGTAENSQESPFRLSKNILREFQLPNGYAAIPIHDKINKELYLSPIEAEDSPIIKTREPRKLLSEPEGIVNDRFYMTHGDRQRLGIRSGQEIYVRFGGTRRAVRVAESKEREDGTLESPLSGNWRVAANIIKEFGIPEGVSLRTAYDKNIHEFSFGPSMAHLNKIEDLGNGEIKIQGGEKFFQQADRQSKEYGVFACVIDPNRQNPDILKAGLVDAFIVDSQSKGKWKKVRIPIPDVAYDKDITPRSEVGKQLEKLFLHNIISSEQQSLTKDKLRFSKMFENSKLATYHPETELLQTTDGLDNFLNTHGKIMIKPRFGQQGRGIISVEKDANGYLVRSTIFDDKQKSHPFEKRVKTVGEILGVTQSLRGERQYIMQERISLAQYTYKHKGVSYTRTPEIRVTIQRGIDAQARITGMIARLLDPKLTGEEYLEDPVRTLEKVFPSQAEGILTDIRALGISALKLFEGKIGKISGELTFDIGIESDGSPIIIEANSKAETRMMYMDEGVKNEDGAYQSTARPLEYSLFLTDMN